jgi:hypothetical protein
MPNAKDRIKASGDTHLPEVEADEFDMQGSHPEGTGTEGTQARDRSRDGEGDPARGGNKAGELKDRDNPTSNSYGDTRDSGER